MSGRTTKTNELVYMEPQGGCGCYAFVNATASYHSRKELDTELWQGNRLVRGTGQPVATATTEQWPADDEWPMYLRSPDRGSWGVANIAASPKIAWTAKPLDAIIDWPDMTEIREAVVRVGPISAPSSAESVVALGSYDQQAVVVLDQETGQEQWRALIDGRINSPPTIYQAAVFAGSRNGWIYAFNRDNGELIWKFFAAQHPRLLAAHGGLESAWPNYGTVMIADGLVWLNAGRHVELDNGVAWWALHPTTGEVKDSGVLRDEGVWLDDEGKKLATVELPAQPINNGLAIAGDTVYVTLQDAKSWRCVEMCLKLRTSSLKAASPQQTSPSPNEVWGGSNQRS